MLSKLSLLEMNTFPTRRSSDLWQRKANESVGAHFQQDAGEDDGTGRGSFGVRVGEPGVEREHGNLNGKREKERSEEHTSELQSRREIVCRLLLEKKKNIFFTSI